MTGMRSCTSATHPRASVVRMVNESRSIPSGFFHLAQRPAKAKGRRSVRCIQQGCFFPEPSFFHSKNPSVTTRQRLLLKLERNAGFSGAVSDRALIMRSPMAGSLAHEGTRPQRARATVLGPASSERTMGTSWVGETLKRGESSGNSSTPKRGPRRFGATLVRVYRPHMARASYDKTDVKSPLLFSLAAD